MALPITYARIICSTVILPGICQTHKNRQDPRHTGETVKTSC